MNLVMSKKAELANGVLLLRVYDQRSYLSVIPDKEGEPVFKREYNYYEADRAQQDYETIRKVASA